MKFVALVSGGKDSIYSIMECQRNGHELVACVHLGAPECAEEESYMYQTAASEVLPVLVEECLGVPLILHRRVGKSVNTSLVYETTSDSDEVEDLHQALAAALEEFPSVQAVSSGAILSTYQRVRIEHVCSRLGLTSLSYLWRMAPQKDLLIRMIEDGIEAVLVKTACPPGLVPQKHLNKSLGQLYYSGLFQRLHDKYQFHMCGEGGEFETLVLDCPVYKKRLVLDQVEIVETDDGVGDLIIKKCHAEDKTGTREELPNEPEPPLSETKISPSMNTHTCIQCLPLPHVRRVCGGLFHVSEIMSPIAAILCERDMSEADLAVEEALLVFQALDMVLSRNNATAHDVVFVHLYLSEISHFANINSHYRDFFGTLLPPSRSCVAVGKHVLPGGRRVMMDCMVQCGSGRYMRSSEPDQDAYANAARLTTSTKLRHVLHVQSISYWAPVCVGPYSQANTLRSGVHFLAGQIGLVPSTMKLHTSWTRQLEQCWTNVASVLDALGSGSLKDMLSGLVYVSHEVSAQASAWQIVESISQKQLSGNGGITPGLIELTGVSSDQFGGYEDEDTWREVTKQNTMVENALPLLLVSISEMPVGALVEVEVMCATQRAASCLKIQSTWDVMDEKSNHDKVERVVQWESGHDFPVSQEHANEEMKMKIHVASRSLGYGCAAVSVVTASSLMALQEISNTWIDIDSVLNDMIEAFVQSVLTESSGLTLDHVLHVRLFYMSASLVPSKGESIQVKPLDDGSRLRCALHSALTLRWCKQGQSRTINIPACTVVPVQEMTMIKTESDGGGCNGRDHIGGHVLLAMQLLLVDPIHTETEIWIHDGREEG